MISRKEEVFFGSTLSSTSWVPSSFNYIWEETDFSTAHISKSLRLTRENNLDVALQVRGNIFILHSWMNRLFPGVHLGVIGVFMTQTIVFYEAADPWCRVLNGTCVSPPQLGWQTHRIHTETHTGQLAETVNLAGSFGQRSCQTSSASILAESQKKKSSWTRVFSCIMFCKTSFLWHISEDTLCLCDWCRGRRVSE